MSQRRPWEKAEKVLGVLSGADYRTELETGASVRPWNETDRQLVMEALQTRWPLSRLAAEPMATAVLDALAGAGRIRPVPVETRTEWGVWWHAGDPGGIRAEVTQLASERQADDVGLSRLGEYGTDSYTVIRREHRRYSDDSQWTNTWRRYRHVSTSPGLASDPTGAEHG